MLLRSTAVSCVLLAGVAFAQRFEDLEALYRYDRAAPLNVHETDVSSRGRYKLYSIKYALPKGDVKTGFLVVPDGLGRMPAIIWMHSSGAMQLLGDAVLMARAGAVSILVESGGIRESPEQSREAMIADVVALRRAVDVLEQPEGCGLVADRHCGPQLWRDDERRRRKHRPPFPGRSV